MKKLDLITRTEVFFTAHLYISCKEYNDAISGLLARSLNIDDKIKIVDGGFEVCLFRDFAKEGCMRRFEDKKENRKSFEKQTFDNVFILSNNAIVLVEAKANQKFTPTQNERLGYARELILADDKLTYSEIYLVGIHSSLYSPRSSTIDGFDGIITWKQLQKCAPNYANIFERADDIYNDRISANN